MKRMLMGFLAVILMSSGALAKSLVSCVVKNGSGETLVEKTDLLNAKVLNGEVRVPKDVFSTIRLQLNRSRAFLVLASLDLSTSHLDLEAEEPVWDVDNLIYEVQAQEIWYEPGADDRPINQGSIVASATFRDETTLTLGGTGLTHFYKVSCSKK